MQRTARSVIAICAISVSVANVWAEPTPVKGGFEGAFGPRTEPGTVPPAGDRLLRPGVGTLVRWNTIAVDASGLDHTPVAPGDTRVFGEQLGPARASRAMAIVHIAMFDSVNAIIGRFRSYTGVNRAPAGASMDAAVAQAAHDTLAALFPSQLAAFDARLAEDLALVTNRRARADGVALGQRAAAAILALRIDDGSEIPDPHVGVDWTVGTDRGDWQVDPISQNTLALGAFWGGVNPFSMRATDQFRVPAPPSLDSDEYAAAYAEAKALGGDGTVTHTRRTDAQTLIGTFWAYDGTPSLCAPPRLYNQIAMQIATQMGTTQNPGDLARLLALLNVSMADAAIAIWDSKFHYSFWRPVTGIRARDGNGDTPTDPTFMPLGAPASNLTGPNFTPPFPSYPSGHAGFGGALFQTLRNFYNRDNVSFTFVSDELNGVTHDHKGTVRPLVPRSFASFSQAEEENGQSRIYLGIHWAFDKTQGIRQGRNVANWVFAHAFTRR